MCVCVCMCTYAFGLTVPIYVALPAAAKSRYEAIKKQTEEELKHTIDEILEQEDTVSFLFLSLDTLH